MKRPTLLILPLQLVFPGEANCTVFPIQLVFPGEGNANKALTGIIKL
jgi:hypothetical protein